MAAITNGILFANCTPENYGVGCVGMSRLAQAGGRTFRLNRLAWCLSVGGFDWLVVCFVLGVLWSIGPTGVGAFIRNV